MILSIIDIEKFTDKELKEIIKNEKMEYNITSIFKANMELIKRLEDKLNKTNKELMKR